MFRVPQRGVYCRQPPIRFGGSLGKYDVLFFVCGPGYWSLEAGECVNGFQVLGVYVDVIVFGECAIVSQSKTLRHESNVHFTCFSYDR